MDDYAGRVLADRYRLPLPPADEYEFVETRAFDTYSGQEVLLRQVPLPEVVEAEVVGAGAAHGAYGAGGWSGGGLDARRGTTRYDGVGDPAVRRAIEAATVAAQVPDHPRLDQVFHVFAEAASLWIVSEYVPARPLAALLAERPLTPHRAAEVAADVLTALRALHAHGWTHCNITTRTVLVCDDGRAMLTGLAAGAAEEALCGFDPVPEALRAPRPREPLDDAVPDRATEPDARPAAGAPRVDAGAVPSARPGTGADSVREAAPGGPPSGPGRRGTPRHRRRPRSYGAAPPAPSTGTMARRAAARQPAVRASPEPTHRGAPRPRARRARAPSPPTAPGRRPPRARPPRARPSTRRRARPGAAVQDEWWAEGQDEPYWDDDQQVAEPEAPEASEVAEDADADARVAPAEPRGGDGYRGPDSALAAERARPARIVVVGAVTERWAPEQAGPVYENCRLAPPVGPAADLWAVGVLLFRAVQGHAPYPEDSASELVHLVCAELPAYAEECGALRPVVESLMRQDPTKRPDFEELRGWLRSLIRSAPEPDVGSRTVTVPPAEAIGPGDPKRLPILRRRGELVRRRRQAAALHGRHRHKRGRPPRVPRQRHETHDAAPRQEKHLRLETHDTAPPRESRAPGARLAPPGPAAPGADTAARGRCAVRHVVHTQGRRGGGRGRRRRHLAQRPPATGPEAGRGDPGERVGDTGPTGQQPQSTDPSGLAKGFALRKDPDGFQVAVAEDWKRRPPNGRGQIRYLGSDYEMIVVPGRDKTAEYGGDPMKYEQNLEPELAPYRDSDWASATGLRRIDVGQTAMAEGAFGWKDTSGRQVYVRNLAMIISGRYHVLQIIGPADERGAVDRYFDQASASYRATR